MPGAQKISATFPLSKLEQVERIASREHRSQADALHLLVELGLEVYERRGSLTGDVPPRLCGNVLPFRRLDPTA
jgi:hypothetical protein